MTTNLKKRIAVAFTFGPLMIVLIWLGGIYNLLLFYLITLAMTLEYLRFPEFKFKLSEKILVFLFSIWAGIMFYCEMNDLLIPVIATFLFGIMILEIPRKGDPDVTVRVGRIILVMLTYAFLPYFGIKLRFLGRAYLYFPLVLAWTLDTFAYFGGIWWGKRKLAPSISPGKTVVGSISGVAGALIVGVCYGLFSPISMKNAIPLAFLGGIIGQIGDLFESKIKREAGVKDASPFLPGHGGFLDFFDSIVLLFPFFYFWFTIIE
ncbi:phosphatidate cytidylyltransferase [bacterium]|nr:phosphatidate cytidylyltransferase [bacterium]